MNGITTHILDVSRGLPAQSVRLNLGKWENDAWILLSEAQTDEDGRARFLDGEPEPGIYRLTFHVAAYFDATQTTAFYPLIQIEFTVREPKHHHVPLLLSPFGYSTYRGS